MNEEEKDVKTEQTQETDPFAAYETGTGTSAYAQPMADGATVYSDDKPENVGKGILGILIAALAGIALYNVFSLLGVISALVGALMAFLGVLLYGRFSGRPGSVKGLILTIVICAAATYAAVWSSWVVFFFINLKDQGETIGSCAKYFGELIGINELKGEYIGELVEAYIFTALGFVLTLIKRKK